MQENTQSKSSQQTPSTSQCPLPSQLRLPSPGLPLWKCDLLLLLCEGESYQAAKSSNNTVNL